LPVINQWINARQDSLRILITLRLASHYIINHHRWISCHTFDDIFLENCVNVEHRFPLTLQNALCVSDTLNAYTNCSYLFCFNNNFCKINSFYFINKYLLVTRLTCKKDKPADSTKVLKCVKFCKTIDVF